MSKPPAKEIASEILDIAKNAGKPVVVCFIGGDPKEIEEKGLVAAVSLEDAAHKAVALLKGEPVKDFVEFTMGEEKAEALAREIAGKMAPTQKYVRGFYTGGTLCDEAMKLMIGKLGHIYSNIPLHPEDKLEDARGGKSREHTFLDFGDDEFTVGRPHPMIDPSLRAERVVVDGARPGDGGHHVRLRHRLRLASEPGGGSLRGHPHRQGGGRGGRAAPVLTCARCAAPRATRSACPRRRSSFRTPARSCCRPTRRQRALWSASSPT